MAACDVTEEELKCFKARGELKALEVSKLAFQVSFMHFLLLYQISHAVSRETSLRLLRCPGNIIAITVRQQK